MVSKLTNEMIIDLLKNRDLDVDPFISNAEIVRELNHVAKNTAITRHLELMKNQGTLKYKNAGTMSLYWLPGDFEKRKKKFQMNMGWVCR